VSTVPEVIMEEVIISPKVLLAVAPGSINRSPTRKLIVEEPLREIFGTPNKSSERYLLKQLQNKRSPKIQSQKFFILLIVIN